MIKSGARLIVSLAAVALCAAPVAPSLTRMADQLVAAEAEGKPAEAEHLASALIHAAEKNCTKCSVLPWALDRLGSLRQDQSRYQEARQLYERSIRLWKLHSSVTSLGLAHALNDLASLYSDIGQLHKSELLCRRSLSIRVQLKGASDPDVALGYSNLATVLFLEGRLDAAKSFANKAIKTWKRTSPSANRADVAYNTLARLRLHQHRFEEARAYINTAIRHCKKVKPADSLHLAEYFQTLGLINTASAKFRDAVQAFTNAVALFRRANAVNSLEYIDTRAEYAAVLQSTGHERKAKQLERECNASRRKIIRRNDLQYSVDVSSLKHERR